MDVKIKRTIEILLILLYVASVILDYTVVSSLLSAIFVIVVLLLERHDMSKGLYNTILVLFIVGILAHGIRFLCS